jgi:phosphoribosylformimino-5-aminoimidazole carboxamide ribotide isomerase
LQAILSVTQPIGIKLQLGGGIRTLTNIEILLELGVTRVILGTVAVSDPEVVFMAIERFGAEHAVVGIDARDNIVKVRGWQEETLLTPVGLGRRLKAAGIETVIFTNIARDGLQHGVDVTSTQQLAQETGLQVIASGGVATLDDIRSVKAAGLPGVIVGRALYENNFTLEEALQC